MKILQNWTAWSPTDVKSVYNHCWSHPPKLSSPTPHPTTKLFKSTVSLKWHYIYLNTLMGACGRCKMMICVPYNQLGSVISSYTCSQSFGLKFHDIFPGSRWWRGVHNSFQYTIYSFSFSRLDKISHKNEKSPGASMALNI